MRTIYSVLFYILIPFILLRLLWRSIKAPEYRLRWGERLGCYLQNYPGNVVWFHAVSVGEAEAVFPLVRQFQQYYPQKKILITTTTPTGSARVKKVMGQSVAHVYLPYDIPFAVKRFMRCFKPQLAVIVETEIWPNLYHWCGQNQVPLFLVNARLSKRSSERYKKIPALVHPVLKNLKAIATQSSEDAGRFMAIGAQASQLITAGNIKFDINVPSEIITAGKRLKASLFQGRFIVLAASTHHGEELILLEIYQTLKQKIPELLMVIVPRHPERFGEVSQLCARTHIHCITRTSAKPCGPDTDVYLADTMGELKLLYAAADLAFIGGSLVEIGGHNLLEAIAVGVPVLFGPYMANFKEIAQKVVAHDAAISCPDKTAIIKHILELYSDEELRNSLSQKGLTFLQTNRGVTERVFDLLAKELEV